MPSWHELQWDALDQVNSWHLVCFILKIRKAEKAEKCNFFHRPSTFSSVNLNVKHSNSKLNQLEFVRAPFYCQNSVISSSLWAIQHVICWWKPHYDQVDTNSSWHIESPFPFSILSWKRQITSLYYAAFLKFKKRKEFTQNYNECRDEYANKPKMFLTTWFVCNKNESTDLIRPS